MIRRNKDYAGKRAMNMELPGKRKRCMDVAREDVEVLGLTAENANERGKKRETICGGDP